MALGIPAQTMMNLAPSVGHIILSYAAIDTMMALTIEMVRPQCERDGTKLAWAYKSTTRIAELEKAFKCHALDPWRTQGEGVICGIRDLKVVRDLLAHGQLDINSLDGNVLYFMNVKPTKSSQEATVSSITGADLKKQATIAVNLQASFLPLIARMSEREGGWA